MAWWDALLNSAGGYVSNNPLEALTLGVGAAGTGMGIYEMMRARQAQADRQKQIDELYRQGPESFMPRQTPAQLAAFLKPYQADLAMRGIDPSSGSGQAALADALLKNYMTLYQQGAGTYGQKIQALGLGGGDVGGGDTSAFGKALAYAMLARAAGRQTNPSPGLTDFAAPTAATGNPGYEFGLQRAWERDPSAMGTVPSDSSWLNTPDRLGV